MHADSGISPASQERCHSRRYLAMKPNAERKPGDLVLDRYMAHATEQEREAARDNLRAFAAVVIGIAQRRALEESEPTRENPDSGVEFSERPLPPS
jgi:hypothetical protein